MYLASIEQLSKLTQTLVNPITKLINIFSISNHLKLNGLDGLYPGFDLDFSAKHRYTLNKTFNDLNYNYNPEMYNYVTGNLFRFTNVDKTYDYELVDALYH